MFNTACSTPNPLIGGPRPLTAARAKGALSSENHPYRNASGPEQESVVPLRRRTESEASVTDQNTLKRRIRARMAKTGESYTAARRSIVGTTSSKADLEGVVPGYQTFGGGAHHDSALMSNVLAQAGVTAPHTGVPFTEAMLAGLAGGIGVMYFVFEYEGHLPMLTMVLRHHPEDFIEGLLRRVGADHRIHTTGSRSRAEATLRSVIADGRAAVCRVTAGSMPYQDPMPTGDHHEIAIVGIAGDTALVDDEWPKPHHVSMAQLAAARARTAKHKHRLIEVVSPKVDANLETGIRDAIAKTCSNLTGPVLGNNFDSNFGFRGLEKLATELRSGTQKGWLARFSDPDRMFVALQRLYVGIESEWGSTGGMRPLYADFLDEAGTIVTAERLSEAATLFRQAGTGWQRLAESSMPAGVPGLGRVPDVLEQMQAMTITARTHPSLGSSALDDLRAEFVDSGGLSSDDARSLFLTMSDAVEEILAIERDAVDALSTAVTP